MAVKHILARSSDPAPYLLSGPPCTGKTVTLAEAIKQLQQTSVNILACAHLNRAADLLCTEILKDNPEENSVFRFYCLSYPVKKIPAELQRHCNLEDNMIVIPSIEELMQYQVIVSTLVNVSRLVTGGLPRGHFSSIFVDDAGQVAETECIIPLADLLDPERGQVVLAGDPKQLGYTNTANLVKIHGIDESLMERLMKRDLYHRLNRRFITDLQKNYSCHSDILEILDNLFYEKELQAMADIRLCNSYCKWRHLPMKGFPLIFHEVAGRKKGPGNGKWLCNMAEVDVVVDYVKKIVLKEGGVTKIGPKDLGVITPYRKQVGEICNALKMDTSLAAVDLRNVKVDTVENFMGEVYKAIVVSTVNSNPTQRMLGLVNNKKKFNTAISRAQDLLIVVGNQRELQTDESWDEFIKYCWQYGGYVTSPVPAFG
ncbi:putative helicase mov-10-B.2 [Genypterus blacodes]|uniref:putative helicase mov-10-B.2 n=1 Tax=Genypterus blacodes TaxID=154954 RepID=UPI003F774F2E